MRFHYDSTTRLSVLAAYGVKLVPAAQEDRSVNDDSRSPEEFIFDGARGLHFVSRAHLDHRDVSLLGGNIQPPVGREGRRFQQVRAGQPSLLVVWLVGLPIERADSPRSVPKYRMPSSITAEAENH